MNVEIVNRPSYSMAVISLLPSEKIRAEAGAMVSKSDGVDIETKATGGILKSLSRSILGGESFFQNVFQAPDRGGEITFAPDLPGDITVVEMHGENLMIQAGSYLASEIGIELSTKISKKAFLAGEGISMLEAKGEGKLLLSSYGAIFERYLENGERYIVDSSHLVLFDATMDVQLKTVGGLKSTLFGGEGLVVQICGPGRLLIQTRSPSALVRWLIPQLPKNE